MKKSVRGFLFIVLVLNAVGLAFLGGGGLPSTRAQESVETPVEAEPELPQREALRLLGEQLAQRAELLTQREAEIEELLRGGEVLRKAGLEVTSAEGPTVEPAPTETTTPPTTATEVNAEPGPAERAFAQLSRAYENMEPESAALALSELASIDQEAVVQLLSTWQPRTSGAILDALTQTHPALAAQLSYEIWKRSGKK